MSLDEVIEDYFDANEAESIVEGLPFYLENFTTSDKFLQYVHPIILRPQLDAFFDENSDVNIHFGETLPYFLHHINLFCSKHNIVYKNIIRAGIQSTFCNLDYPQSDPHIDFTKPSIVILMYMSKVSPKSETIVYDITYPENDAERILLEDVNVNDIPIKKRIVPEYGKIVAFNALNYHANKHPLPGENRIVAVFNLLL